MGEETINTSGIVKILNNLGESVGTGFFINDNRIITCYHILKEMEEEGKSLYSDKAVNYQVANTTQVCSAKLILFDYKKDIALLSAEFPSEFYYEMVEQELKVNDKLSTYGFPLDGEKGMFSYPTFMGVDNTIWQLGNANEITVGFSGAPLIISTNKVVGMITEYGNEIKGRNIFVALGLPSKTIIKTFNVPFKKNNNLEIEKKRGINTYRKFIKEKTDNIGFKGIESIARTDAKTLKLYEPLYIKNRYGISNSETTLSEVFIAERGIIIKGEPGSGKSTFIKYMVRNELENQGNVVPFIIQLESFGKFIIDKKLKNIEQSSNMLIDYILNEYPQKGFGFDFNMLDEVFSKGLGWFLFDGFDEIDSETAKQNVIIFINHAFDYWNCKFVITSRPYALNSTCLKDFQTIYIDILHMDQIEKYINNFAGIINVNQYLIDANGLINIIRKSPAINELARIPVMLTFICFIYLIQDEIPENKYEILDKIIGWLIKTKYNSEIEQEEMLHIYASIALEMFKGTSPQKEIESSKLYLNYGNNKSKYDFFNSLNDVGIIVKCGGKTNNERYSFWHFCFQEYLTAKALCENSTDNYSILLEHWFDKEWQEVIVLYFVCLLNIESKKMVTFVDYICEHLLSLDLERCIKGSSLLGSIFKEVYPNISFLKNSLFWSRLKKKIQIVFEKDLPKISIQDKCNAAIAYGLSKDDRLSDFNKTFIKITAGSYYIGAQNKKPYRRKYDPKATEFECPIKEISLTEFEIRKYPITVEEFEQFILNKGYTESKEIWTKEGLDWREENNIQYPRNWRRQRYLRNSPVTGISWYEAVAYCNWLTINTQGKYLYKLPSESQWEYAYSVSHDIYVTEQNINCYDENVDIQDKTPIGIFPSSTAQCGLTDMLGNVEEWCADSWYPSLSKCPLDGSAMFDPHELSAVTRGGSTIRTKRLCRYTYRARCHKNTRYDTIGFRIIRQERL